MAIRAPDGANKKRVQKVQIEEGLILSLTSASGKVLLHSNKDCIKQ